MSSPTISASAGAFLRQHQPFSFLPEEVCNGMAGKLQMVYLQPGETVFEQDTPPGELFYMVYRGAVDLVQQTPDREVLIDVCSEGDIFGARAIFAEGNYMSAARAREETLLYGLSAAETSALMGQYPQVARFFVANFAATLPGRAQKLGEAISASKPAAATPPELDEGTTGVHFDHRTVRANRKVITGKPDISVQEAAEIMCRHNIGSLIIASEDRRPMGIITDADLRRKVVSKGLVAAQASVSDIMSSPVLTVTERQTVSDLIILMMQRNIRHFCITEDGTPDTPVTGIISERDIVTTRGSNPAVIYRQVQLGRSVEELRTLRDQLDELIVAYLEQGIRVGYITRLVSEINDALIARCVQMAEEKLREEGLPEPSVRYCWLSLGSEGRMEQLLRTDQDNAILFEDGATDTDRVWLLRLGQEVSRLLMVCGFEKCPGDMMASNPKWCQPLAGWARLFRHWIEEPEPVAILHANIFFDFRPVYGYRELARQLKQHIFSLIDQNERFKSFFAFSALKNPPPLSFFRNFILEKEGGHTDRFDIKARAMMPLCDAARVLAYDHRQTGYESTAGRYRLAARQEPGKAGLFSEAAEAYEQLVRLRATEGLGNSDSGRYVEVEKLGKMERQNLKNIFKLIGEVQQLLRVRYRTDFLG